MPSFISSKTLSEIYKYFQSTGGSYNDLKNYFQNSGIEPDENFNSPNTTNKGRFLDKYIRPLDLSQRGDLLKFIDFLEQALPFPPTPESDSVLKCLRQDGWQIVGNHIVQSVHDVEGMILSMAEGHPIGTIQTEWERAILSVNNDPADALTAANSMLEATFKYILHNTNTSIPAQQDIRTLSKLAYPLLNMSPGQETDSDFRTLIQGTISVIQSLGALRTKIGDAHGASPTRIGPDDKHARLATNMAGALSIFLLETYLDNMYD